MGKKRGATNAEGVSYNYAWRGAGTNRIKRVHTFNATINVPGMSEVKPQKHSSSGARILPPAFLLLLAER